MVNGCSVAYDLSIEKASGHRKGLCDWIQPLGLNLAAEDTRSDATLWC